MMAFFIYHTHLSQFVNIKAGNNRCDFNHIMGVR